jgi:hypothetical protein
MVPGFHANPTEIHVAVFVAPTGGSMRLDRVQLSVLSDLHLKWLIRRAAKP